MGKKIISVVSIVLAIGLCAFFVGINSRNKKADAKYEALNEERRPLNVKKQKLEQELAELELAYQIEVEPNAIAQVIFPSPSEQVYSSCYPVMKEYGYVGMLALSLNQLPGQPGYMTVEQFHELLEAGWGICITWQTDTAYKKWLPKLQKELTTLGIEQGKTVYFPKGVYNAELDATILKAGFSISVSCTPDEGIPLQTKFEEGVWHIGAVGLMSRKPRLWLNEAVVQKANIAYLVGFELEDELYNEQSFCSMLQCFREYEDTNELVVTTIEDSADQYFYRGRGVDPEFDSQYQTKKAALEQEIAQVKQQLAEIDEKY